MQQLQQMETWHHDHDNDTSLVGRWEGQNKIYRRYLLSTRTHPSPWSPPTGYLCPGRHSQEITGLLLTTTAWHTSGQQS